jgi:hypothetical protein
LHERVRRVDIGSRSELYMWKNEETALPQMRDLWSNYLWIFIKNLFIMQARIFMQ